MKRNRSVLIIILFVFISASYAQELKIYSESIEKYCIMGKIYYDDQEVCSFTEQPNTATGSLNPGEYSGIMTATMFGDGWGISIHDEQNNEQQIYIYKFMDETGEKIKDKIVLFIGAEIMNCKIRDTESAYKKIEEVFNKLPIMKVFDTEDPTIRNIKIIIENEAKVDKKIKKMK